MVALRLGRRALGVDLNPAYCDLARRRIRGDCPMFNTEDGEER
jgi:DNA modification methylase